jgi:probable rRNA maturation factor
MSSTEGTTVTFRRKPADVRPRALEVFARLLERRVCKGRPFDCLIAGDAELRRLNRDFRGKDYATDVLSFPAAAPAGTRTERLGDLAISLARARAQARRFGHTTEQEVRVLMLHGALHLCGMDHETDSGRMQRAEKRWRAEFKLPDGLIERVRT